MINKNQKDLIILNRSIFFRFKCFFRKLFKKNLKKEYKKDFYLDIEKKLDFKKNLKLSIDENNIDILKQQINFENGNIKEEDMDEKTKIKLNKLYQNQIADLKKLISINEEKCRKILEINRLKEKK